MSSARGSLRSIILELFPWMARFGLTAGKDLAIKSASGKVEVEGPGPAVHRVGDLGSAGTLSQMLDPPGLLWTGPEGSSWKIVATVGGSAVAFEIIAITPVGGAGKIITKATTGSEKVSAG